MPSLKQTIIRGGLEGLYFTGAHVALKPLVGGVGAILTLHHVRPPRPDRFQPNRGAFSPAWSSCLPAPVST